MPSSWLLLVLPLTVLSQCPPLGPNLPRATNLTGSSTFTTTLAGITEVLTNNTAFNATAVTVTIGTTDGPPLLQFHNSPTQYNSSGSHDLTCDTQFIVASVSKLFTAFGVRLLHEKVSLSDPITRYIPELLKLNGKNGNPISSTNWNDITIEALLSHMSGIADDLGDSDIANGPGPNGPANVSSLGLPTLNATDGGTQCGDADCPYERPCSQKDFFDNWGRKYPAYAPFTTPVYSNIGFALLGLVIERASGSSYADFMQKSIISPLNLTGTSVNHPSKLEDAFVTAQAGDGDLSQDFLASSGAVYSSANDLYSLGKSILSSTLLPPSQTRSWLTPRTFTSSSGTFVGEAWEIARGLNLTGDGSQIVDVYTKSGNLDLYSSIIALVPDYDLIIAVTSGGPDTNAGVIQVLFSQIVSALVPALDQVARAQAQQRYAGTYTTGSNSITLSVDEGPGLLVTNFSVNGVDTVIDGVGEAMGAAGPGQTRLRLYPTNLQSGTSSAWQGVYDTLPGQAAAAEDALLFFSQGSCQSWSELSLLSYGMRPLDQFILTADGTTGKNVAVDARAWRTVLTRS